MGAKTGIKLPDAMHLAQDEEAESQCLVTWQIKTTAARLSNDKKKKEFLEAIASVTPK